MLESYIKDQKITCLARSSTSNPNNGDLATHCHGNFARLNGKMKIHLQTCDFSTNMEESTFYHSHPMNNRIIRPISLYRYDDNSTEMTKWAFIKFWSDWAHLASRCIRHGELRFLHQWVSATSALRSFGRLSSPREYIVRHGEWPMVLSDFCSPSTHRCELGASYFLCSLTLLVTGSPSARHGELTFALFLCFPSLLGV